jgi:hypothetical protein
LPFAPFGNTGLFADCVKSIQVIKPKATAKPTGQRVEFGMRKELQRQIATIQNHPGPDHANSRQSQVLSRTEKFFPKSREGRFGVAASLIKLPSFQPIATLFLALDTLQRTCIFNYQRKSEFA